MTNNEKLAFALGYSTAFTVARILNEDLIVRLHNKSVEALETLEGTDCPFGGDELEALGKALAEGRLADELTKETTND